MTSEPAAATGAIVAPAPSAAGGWPRFVGGIVACLLRLRHATWTKDARELDKIDALLASGERAMVVFWHGNYVPLFTLLSGRQACMFASDSFRGHILAEIGRRFGYACVHLPDRGGRRSRELMREGLDRYRVGAVAVDGPMGPFHAVKPGVVQLASTLGFVLVPVSVSANRMRVNDKRWDLMEAPRLFSRVYLAVGEPVRVAPGLDEAGLAAARAALGQALDDVTWRARAAAATGPAA